MKNLNIIFIDQLSKDNPVLKNPKNGDYYLFYEPLDTFYEIKHHKQKITLLVSGLRNILNDFKHQNVIHKKIQKTKVILDEYLKAVCDKHKFNKITVSKPSDFNTYKNLLFFSQSNNIELEVLKDKKFISHSEDFSDWASDKKTRIQEYYYCLLYTSDAADE